MMKEKTYSTFISYRDKQIGRRIRRHRLLAGVKQSELAKKLDISPQQLQKYETGVNRIAASRLQLLAKILDVPITLFFEDKLEEDPLPAPQKHRDKHTVRLINLYRAITSPRLRRHLLITASIYAKELGTPPS